MMSRKNHYVPKVYLKNWCNENNKLKVYQILVSNENVPLWTEKSIQSIACYPDIYTTILDDQESDYFEQWFDKDFEAKMNLIFQKIIHEKKLDKKIGII